MRFEVLRPRGSKQIDVIFLSACVAVNLFDAVRGVRAQSRQCPLTVRFYLKPQASGSGLIPSIEIVFYCLLLDATSTTSACVMQVLHSVTPFMGVRCVLER